MAGMYSTDRRRVERWRRIPRRTNTGVAFTLTPVANDIKPTFNANLTWVKGNHTYKLGATALFEGIQSVNASRADGQFGFSQQQTSRSLAKRPAVCKYRQQRIRLCQLLSWRRPAACRLRRRRMCGWARIPTGSMSRTVGRSRAS